MRASLIAVSTKLDLLALKNLLGLSDGNLSTHLQKLESVDYVNVKKTFIGKKPRTNLNLTKKGKESFQNYIEQLESILGNQH